jgi:O-antigen/teichoic acid export membrane protein
MKQHIVTALRWSEKYTRTDMVYLAHGNFWLVANRFLAALGGVAFTYLFANLLTPEEFGRYKYIISLAGFFGALSLSGIGGGITLAVTQGKQNIVPKLVRIAGYYSLPASIGALLGSIYYFTRANTELGSGLLLIALTNSFASFGFYKNILLGKKDFKLASLLNIPRTYIPLAILITTLLLTKNVLLLLVVYFLSNFILSYLVYRNTISRYQIVDNPEGSEFYTSYGKHMSIIGGVSQLIGSLDQIILWHFAGPLQLATYAFALAPIREIRNFSDNIFPVILPKYAEKTVAEMKRSARLRITQLTLASAVVAFAYIAAAPFLFKIFFPQYLNAVFMSQLLAATLVLQGRNIVETMLYAQGDTQVRYKTTLIPQFLKLILWLILIPAYGLLGAIISLVITDIVSTIALWWGYKRL